MSTENTAIMAAEASTYLTEPVNLTDLFSEELDGLRPTFERIKIPAGGALSYEVPGDDPNSPDMAKDFCAVILYHHPVNSYFKEKFNGSANPPECSSIDGKIGVERDSGECHDCKTCPMAQFGSGENGGMACKQKRCLYLLREGEILPILMTLPTGSMQRYIQKALGYALTGDTSEQALFILYGTGSNGKSTLLNVYSELMATYAQSTPSDTFMQKKNEAVNNDIARLKGARFVSAIEMEENKRMAESIVKSMTGGDKLVTRFLYGEFFEYVPQFKVFLAVNHKPVIRDTTNSIWRRIKLIPFEATFTEQERDKNFPARIMATELPGILAWAVQGCLMWQHEGLTMPDYVNTATQKYKDEMDSFATFFNECCEDREGGRVSNKLLRAKYDEWCKENGEYALTQRPFSQKLIERGYTKKNSSASGTMEWHGFVIRGEASRL